MTTTTNTTNFSIEKQFSIQQGEEKVAKYINILKICSRDSLCIKIDVFYHTFNPTCQKFVNPYPGGGGRMVRCTYCKRNKFLKRSKTSHCAQILLQKNGNNIAVTETLFQDQFQNLLGSIKLICWETNIRFSESGLYIYCNKQRKCISFAKH